MYKRMTYANKALMWMMGPSGPMHIPDGMEAIMPINFAAIKLKLVKDVSLPVIWDIPK